MPRDFRAVEFLLQLRVLYALDIAIKQCHRRRHSNLLPGSIPRSSLANRSLTPRAWLLTLPVLLSLPRKPSQAPLALAQRYSHCLIVIINESFSGLRAPTVHHSTVSHTRSPRSTSLINYFLPQCYSRSHRHLLCFFVILQGQSRTPQQIR